jgi:hypothetical protein
MKRWASEEIGCTSVATMDHYATVAHVGDPPTPPDSIGPTAPRIRSFTALPDGDFLILVAERWEPIRPAMPITPRKRRHKM